MALDVSVWPGGAVEQLRTMAQSLSSVSGRIGDTEVAQLRALAKSTVLLGFGDAEIAACVAEALNGLAVGDPETPSGAGDAGRTPCPLPSTRSAARTGPIRLAKISPQVALIVELDPRSLSFVEYDPLRPGDTWHGAMVIRGSGHRAAIELSVGPYLLTAPRVLQDGWGQMTGLRRNAGHFSGIETGPHGDQEFDVFLLADDLSTLVNPTSVDFWLCFTAGTFVPVTYRTFLKPHKPPETIRLPERGRGATRFRVRSDLSDNTRIECDGVHGGQTWHARIRHWPESLSDGSGLRLDLEDGFAAGAWELSDNAVSESLSLDAPNCCYRSAHRVLYPTATRTDLIDLIAQRAR